jgi:hypothetical protein
MTDPFWIRHAHEHGEAGLCWRELRGRRAGRKRGDYQPACSRRGAHHGTGRRHETRQRLRLVGLEDPKRPQPVADAAMLRCGGIRGRLQPVVADNALADGFAQVVFRVPVQRCRQRHAHRQQDDEETGRYGERASERAKHPEKRVPQRETPEGPKCWLAPRPSRAGPSRLYRRGLKERRRRSSRRRLRFRCAASRNEAPQEGHVMNAS